MKNALSLAWIFYTQLQMCIQAWTILNNQRALVKILLINWLWQFKHCKKRKRSGCRRLIPWAFPYNFLSLIFWLFYPDLYCNIMQCVVLILLSIFIFAASRFGHDYAGALESNGHPYGRATDVPECHLQHCSFRARNMFSQCLVDGIY